MMNINDLISPIKRHRPSNLLPTRNIPHWQRKHRFRVKEWKKIFHENGAWKQAEVAIHIADKADFKPKLFRIDKEDHFILINGIIHQEGITVINTYALNIGPPSFVKQTILDIKTDRPHYNNCGCLQYPTLTINKSYKLRNFRIKWHYGSNGLNRF
jgi:hypothetical protein